MIAIHLLFQCGLVSVWLGSVFTCQARFWLAVTLFPTCLAAFQVPNAKLVAYYHANLGSDPGHNSTAGTSVRNLLYSWRHWTVTRKTYFSVVAGLICQIVASAFMFFGSRRFHADYGLWGQPSNATSCLYGFEWVVAVMWQAVWAYAVGIVLLRQIRRINDVYHWACETRIAIFASMPGPLLWAVFMFTRNHTLDEINMRWPPVFWLFPGLLVVQLLLIGYPLWNVCNAERALSRTSHSSNLTNSSVRSMKSFMGNDGQRLIEYAARTRFNAELVIFLRDVDAWKALWSASSSLNVPMTQTNEASCFRHAALIYFKLVDVTTADFPINISAKTRMLLAESFRTAKYMGSRGTCSDITTSWIGGTDSEADSMTPEQMQHVEVTLADAEKNILLNGEQHQPQIRPALDPDSIRLPSLMQPKPTDETTLRVFDRAYREVETEAYNNIWLAFVNEGHEAESRVQA